MSLTFRLQGIPLSFTQLDENFRTVHRNARVWDSNEPYELHDITYYEGCFYEVTSATTAGVSPDMLDSGWTPLPLDASSVDLSNYLTIAEADARFVNTSGDTINGSLVINDLISAFNLTGTNTGDERYTNQTPVPTSLGGISAGMSFNNMTIQQMFDYILYPELYPTLTAPSCSFTTSSLNTYYEVGYQIPTISFLSSFNRGSINPAYGTTGYRSGLPTQYNYSGSGLITVSSSSLSNSQSVSNYIVTPGTQSWSNSITYAQGEQPLSSKGNNYNFALPAGTTSVITRSTTGIYPFLFGMSASVLDGTTIYPTFSSTKLIQAQGNKSITLDGNLQYIYFAYPSSYSDLISIIDPNGFNVTSSFTKTTMNITSTGLASNYTTQYKVYRTIDQTTVINNTFQFKFS